MLVFGVSIILSISVSICTFLKLKHLPIYKLETGAFGLVWEIAVLLGIQTYLVLTLNLP